MIFQANSIQKKVGVAKEILAKKGKAGGIALIVFTLYYKVIVIKTV